MSGVKSYIKKIVKRGLLNTAKLAKKNKLLKKVGVSVRNSVYPGMFNNREVYEYLKYYPSVEQYLEQIEDIKNFSYTPLISIVMPTYNTAPQYLKHCIDSVMRQSYSNWELCIADDASTDPQVIQILEEYSKRDPRIKYKARKINGHISAATNTAISIAKGEYISLLDHDDVLWPNALYETVKVINDHKDVDFIYSDEDKINSEGDTHSYPFLKPSWSPEFLESCNYITHFSTIRSKIIKKVGGFREGYEGAQDWDLFIRIGEITNKIIHIPKILYSWRIHELSTASDTDAKPYVYEAQKKLLQDHITRQKKSGVVETGLITQHRTILYKAKAKNTLSIVTTLTKREDVLKLVRSINKYKPGTPYEFIVTSNKTYSEVYSGVKINYIDDALTNAAKFCKGVSIVVINKPVTFVKSNWGKRFLADSQIEGVGFVYPVILNSSKKTILSAGYGVGYGEKDGVANMLSGIDFDDNHYTRGLYAKSRRNVAAGNSAIYCASKKNLEAYFKNINIKSFVDFNLYLLQQNIRHLYTPYVQVSYSGKLAVDTFAVSGKFEDPFLNRNFRKNESMEVKA